MNPQTIKLFQSKNTDEWETPQSFYDEIDMEFKFTQTTYKTFRVIHKYNYGKW